MTSHGNRVSYLFAIVLIVLIGALLSAWFTRIGLSTAWWLGLTKSSVQPPSGLFSIAWLVIYLILIGSVFAAVTNSNSQSEINKLMFALGLNMFLQVVWCWAFFTSKNTLAGLILLILTLLAAIWLTYLVFKKSPPGGLFLIVYLGWLTLATYINYDTMRLNS